MKAKYVFEDESLYQNFLSNDKLRNDILHKIINAGYIIHGTNSEFNEFDPSFIKGSNSAVYGHGIYFSDEIYKFSEYGSDPRKFKFVNKKDFNLLDLRLSPKSINFLTIHDIIEGIYYDIVKYDKALDDVRTNKEYIEIKNELDKLEDFKKSEEDKLKNKFVDFIDNEIKNNINVSFENILKNIRSKFSSDNISKEFSMYALNIIGVDGFKFENQYVIFNYPKLNAALIKNNEEFINNFK